MGDSRIKILLLVSSLCFGGAEKHLVVLANALDRTQFEVFFAYLKPDDKLLPQLQTERLGGLLSLNVKGKLDFAALTRLTEYIERHAIDIIVCANGYPALHAFLCARRVRRRPKVVEIFHSVDLQTYKDRLQMQLYRHLFNRCDLLIYVSHNQQSYWRSRGVHARREIVIHNGIDNEEFRDRYDASTKNELRAQWGFAPTDYLAAMCAGLRPEKAHEILLRAVAALNTRGKPIRALLIGDGPERANIERAIQALRLDDKVVITGFQADVRPFIACSDVVVLPSRSETFSIAALEAMALGKPLVLTHVGGADEQVQHGSNGFLFKPNDSDALAHHLETLSSSAVRLQMSGAAIEKVRTCFQQHHMIEHYTQALCHVAGMATTHSMMSAAAA
jgi:glycosyltransferase involved in cell wall biosynthesis